MSFSNSSLRLSPRQMEIILEVKKLDANILETELSYREIDSLKREFVEKISSDKACHGMILFSKQENLTIKKLQELISFKEKLLEEMNQLILLV